MRMSVRWMAVGAVAIGIAFAGPASAGKPAGGGGGGSTGPVFKVGVQLTTPAADPQYGITQGEPSLKIDGAGHMYVAAPASNPIGCETWEVSSTNLSSQSFNVPPPDLG